MHPRLLRPERPRLDQAREAVRGSDDACAAWETLASEGFIPMEWIQHDGRSYVTEARDGARRAYFPPTVEFCVLLAADAPGVMAAEAVAREALPDVARFESVVWRVVRRDAVAGEREQLDRSLRDGTLRVPDRLIETGYCVDVTTSGALVFLMPDDA